MGEKSRKYLRTLIILAVMLGGVQLPISVSAQEAAGQGESGAPEGVVVCTETEFMNALEQKKSPITVNNLITIGKNAEESGRMLPVEIPENTLIQGTAEGWLNARSPIQLKGDGVCFKNIKLTFESTNALGSVPHREIFLAGHSLVLDNVSTYLEGGGGAGLGDFGGTEEELLPSVYAGGYPKTTVGENASLTVCNSNDKTMFAGIYMGHGEGWNREFASYEKGSVLNIDARTLVRDRIDTGMNSQAEINVAGRGLSQYAQAKEIYGNENTVLVLSNISMEEAVADSVGNIVLKTGACMSLKTGSLQNVTLQDGAFLDFNGVMNAVINGNLTVEDGSSGKRGMLVLNQEGTLTINGNIAGTAQFQTRSRLSPGVLLSNWVYIRTKTGRNEEPYFVLAQKYIEEGYELKYTDGAWSIQGGPVYETREIGRIELLSAPEKVDLRKIAAKADGAIPDENVYFEAAWYDTDGRLFSHNEVLEEGLYEMDYIIKIRTDYWEDDAAALLDKTDWYQSVFLMGSEERPGRYYLYADVGEDNNNLATPGDYTFLFCSDHFVGNLYTVADVKALKDKVLAEHRVIFYYSDEQEKPEETGKPVNPEHKHVYKSSVTQKPACIKQGVKTYVCDCGDTYTENMAALGHRYVERHIPATQNRDGRAEQVCSICSAVKNTAVISSPKKIIWGKTDFIYDGKVKTPTVSVRDSSGKKLKSGTDYQVVYPKSRKNPGVYTATIQFCGNYSGIRKDTFTIRPKKTSLKKVIASSKGFQAVWKKQTAQTDGYQLQYSTSKSFKGKTTKLVTAKKNTAGKKISKLRGKKKYYVRIRTYKTVKVKGKNKKLYSDWSARKTVLTKK